MHDSSRYHNLWSEPHTKVIGHHEMDSLKIIKKCIISERLKTWAFWWRIWWNFEERLSVVAVKILCIQKNFHSGILKLSEGYFHQGIKLRIDHLLKFEWQNVRAVIISSSIHLSPIHTHESSSDEPLCYLWSLHLILPRDYFTSKLTF